MPAPFEIGEIVSCEGKVGTVVGSPEDFKTPAGYTWVMRNHDKHRHLCVSSRLCHPTPKQMLEIMPKASKRVRDKVLHDQLQRHTYRASLEQ